ncbi:uncharacterized protein LOC113524029 isoform X1 [Pangasianodon hypophthalmus]|uniref:uncharacterized protein LOC113524029 isoform X1 n=3 Tax=Pangasianodon hypophthalmus TaxID=310915 RepID=UPI000EFF374F|nr:uncharacterized protein LOC113524029 isoform X1 [Pangasianodon hypophthalmus]
MTDTREQRAQSQLIKDKFPQNARFLFFEAVALVSRTELGGDDQLNMNQILEKMLHSILFLGNIHPAKYNPQDIFENSYNYTVELFPGPFNRYRTHVPLQTPFSYFLELVLKCYGQNNEDTVKDKLFKTLKNYKGFGGKKTPLISTVICICENGVSRYYGASLSCGSDTARKIMTAVSCVHVWHLKVSSAVMSVFPDDTGEPRSIKLPDTVKCRAYAVADMRKLKPPCKRCNQLYSLPDHTHHPNPPGNCAETEAISNFFKAEKHGNSRQTLFRHNHQEEMQRMSNCFDMNMEQRMERRSVRDNYSISVVYNP